MKGHIEELRRNNCIWRVKVKEKKQMHTEGD